MIAFCYGSLYWHRILVTINNIVVALGKIGKPDCMCGVLLSLFGMSHSYVLPLCVKLKYLGCKVKHKVKTIDQ